MATTQLVRTIITYAEVREEHPVQWVDTGLSSRTPAPNSVKVVLLVRRADGVLQKWRFAPEAIYTVTGIGLIISGNVFTPVPPV